MRTLESKARSANPNHSRVIDGTRRLPAVFGRVKRVAPRMPLARNDAIFAASEIEAWARRAAAANGFGTADLPAAAQADAGEARARFADTPHRASLTEIARACADLATEALRGALAKWRAARIARATRAALGQLDDRTLNDLGLHRSELGSVAAELARETDASRRRVLLSLHMLSI